MAQTIQAGRTAQNWLFSALKTGLAGLVRRLFRVEIRGLENLGAAGSRALLVVNHVSFLDAVFLALLLPEPPSFAILSRWAGLWWVRPWLRLVRTYTIDPQKPLAAVAIVRALRRGEKCVVFPEGRISATGSLMKVYEGPALVAERTRTPLIPIRIDGLQYSRFSLLKGLARQVWFPQVTLTICPPCPVQLPASLRGRKRRQAAAVFLYDQMVAAGFAASPHRETLFAAFLRAAAIHGADKVVLEDTAREPLAYRQLFLRAMILGRALEPMTAPGEAVGLLLPTAAGAAVVWTGLSAFGRVPAMLNFTAGAAAVIQACHIAGVKRVLTSRRFIQHANLHALAAALEEAVDVVWLEDLRGKIGLKAKLRGVLDSRPARALALHRSFGRRPDDPAVILFTSGSEDTPKAVVLSHANILSNCHQLAASLDYTPAEIMFNALPVFHSFGMTAGMILPLVAGLRVFLYPSPLHFRVVPEMVYAVNATMLFGTDTFLSAYARHCHAYDFRSMRYVFAGAEPLREETRRAWADKFGVRVYEGYGATETAPVLSVNTPMFSRPGSVGRLLPGIRFRLDPVEGIAEGGRLVVAGPNIMLGYMRLSAPEVLEPPPEGWHDTGDIATVDADGFVRIVGRLKRFAKIAGEMVSLTSVESQVSALWPEAQHGAIARRDTRKGEQIVLVTTQPGASRSALIEHWRQAGALDLSLPRSVLVVEALPLLGSGKTDYVSLGRMVEEKLGGHPPGPR